MFRKIALTGASLLAFTLLAWAANAPTYKDSGGVDRRAQGVIIVNPDGSFADMSSGAGGGGTVQIDQTTQGTTNGVQLKAGSAIAGKVGIDQTTPGTTNLVQAGNTTGNVADAATDSGNPVKVGGVYTSGFHAAYSSGQRGDLQLGARGALRVQLELNDNNSSIATGIDTATGQAVSGGTTLLKTLNRTTLYNGSQWDVGFTCPNSAVVNVTAAATTQVVALGASQVIRVCSFSVAMSAAGTAKFVYGTGTNCGTGTTDITGAMPLATGTPWTVTGANGSVFRTASANALCVAAVTGNVVGFVTYAQY